MENPVRWTVGLYIVWILLFFMILYSESMKIEEGTLWEKLNILKQKAMDSTTKEKVAMGFLIAGSLFGCFALPRLIV
jgi:hypothetical protein